LNAANEVAVAAFLAKRIPFLAIANTVSKVLESTSLGKMTTIADAIALDAEIRVKTKEIINKDYK
jgi:1-deoxy-D-xylulose-5-phosphate reductoisomerase